MQVLKWFILKLYKKMPVIAFDSLSIPIAWYLAYGLRYNMQPFPKDVINHYSLEALTLLFFTQLFCYYYFKVYRGLWQFSSINDLLRIIKMVCSSVIIVIPLLYACSLLVYIPRSVLPLYMIIVTTLLCAGRLIQRIYTDKTSHLTLTSRKVLIIGAGQAGEGLARDIKRSPEYLPVGFVDDNPNKIGLEIHGIPVIGTTGQLIDLISQYQPDLIFIAIPSAGSVIMRRIVKVCEICEVPFRTLPSLAALASGFVQINSLREVNIEDLLGRDQVHLDWEKIEKIIYKKRIIVTGGGGSIGSELCRQIIKLKPSRLLIIDNSEFNLYSIEHELKSLYPHAIVETCLISVVDKIAINFHLKQFKPQIIFHAAAYKHVPLLEEQIRSASHNNILGTQIIAEASIDVQAEKFILISTDKAVNPTNIMGTTKRIAEIYCQNVNERSNTQFITVRFGNVLGSAGSVVPLFQKQLQAGGPLTVTHPDISRYFMTIPEASQLILQAMSNGSGGEIFVLDMGEPIKISYLAEQVIRLAGKIPGKDIAIRYTGLRQGEKLFEELFHESEQLETTEHIKLFKAKFRPFDWLKLSNVFDEIHEACITHDNQKLYTLIRDLVPEFKPAVALID